MKRRRTRFLLQDEHFSEIHQFIARDPAAKLWAFRNGMVNTGNPLCAWLAIKVCITHQKEFPEWVMAYLAQCAARMVSDEATKANDLRKVLPWIFDFPKKHGPGSPLNPGFASHPLFLMNFAFRIQQGEDPLDAMLNACNEIFDDAIEEKTLKRWLLKDFGLKKWPNAAEWKKITLTPYHTIGKTLRNRWQRTKSRETLS